MTNDALAQVNMGARRTKEKRTVAGLLAAFGPDCLSMAIVARRCHFIRSAGASHTARWGRELTVS